MELLDFRSNLNPEGPPPWLAEAEEAARTQSAPAVSGFRKAKEACFRRFSFSPDCFVFGEGVNGLLSVLPRALGVDAVLILPPTYSGFQRAAAAAGLPLHLHAAREEDGYTLRPGSLRADMARISGRALVFLGRPNNPAGVPLPIETVIEAARVLPGHFLCVDESYVELSEGVEPVLARGRRLPDNLLVLRSLTKALAIPDLHLGFVGASRTVTRRIEDALELRPRSPRAEEIAFRAVSDPRFFETSAARIAGYRARFAERLSRIPGVKPETGFANFLLVRIQGADARKAAAAARERGVDFRDYAEDDYLDGRRWLRTAVRKDEDNEKAATALEAALREVREAGKA
ncbi:MAG TPA: aminotransferase class I/II-fold pyridoxal phosphate-dependent enzyme [Spirochaetia bacterium]|nr:aminotransferase class I/II-fold pyridoxal phosphate-dependent enzyme [Spirochaetales bacterium]HRY80307.1 aminotransferase class I/II-fold pyridoxal phosphate-dependent enzyme [Spirochaetia bacterium]HRZ87947.1 aminotransferase class I/II-fold pyridoxal phosphate-dependent enzyme [Spirochaetia bacterium]